MKHQLVLVIPAPDALNNYYPEIQAGVARLGGGVGWEKPDHLFLKVNHLGRINDDEIPRVFKTVSAVVNTTSSFSLTIDYFQALYLRHEPSQIYLSVAPSADLTHLQAHLCTRLKTINIPQPAKFLPQIILGKLKRTDPVTTKHLLDVLSDYELKNIIEFPVSKIVLFEVLAQKKSIHYQRIGTFSMLQSAGDFLPGESVELSIPDTPPAA